MNIAELKNIPNEILIKYILPYVSNQYLNLLCQTNQRFHDLCQDPLLWKLKIENEYPEYIEKLSNQFSLRDNYFLINNLVREFPLYNPNGIPKKMNVREVYDYFKSCPKLIAVYENISSDIILVGYICPIYINGRLDIELIASMIEDYLNLKNYENNTQLELAFYNNDDKIGQCIINYRLRACSSNRVGIDMFTYPITKILFKLLH